MINREFGNLFYDESYKGDAMLLRYALNEIAEHLGHSLENPISIHLVCLDLNMPFDVYELIYKDIAILCNSGEISKLKDYDYVKKEIMIKHFPEAENFNELFVSGFMKAISKCYFPELSPHLK